MSEAAVLTLPGVDTGPWQVRHRFDPAAAALADRHYSCEVIGSPPNPGYCFKQAGWWLDREYEHSHLLRFRA